jgi:hypothetical protein
VKDTKYVIKGTIIQAQRFGENFGTHREDLESRDVPLAYEFVAIIPEGSDDEGQRFIVILELKADIEGPVDGYMVFKPEISFPGGLLRRLDPPTVDAVLFALIGARTLATRLRELFKPWRWSEDDYDEFAEEAYPRR